MLLVAKVLKPQGVKGEIKILPLLDTAESFNSINAIIIDNKHYSVDAIRVGGNFVYIKVAGVDTMEQAELLRDKEIMIEDTKAPKLEKGRYYIKNLLGCDIVSDNKIIGKVKEIYQNGSADVYELSSPKGKILFPFLKKLIENMDIENKKIEVISKEFDKVAVYEDWCIDNF